MVSVILYPCCILCVALLMDLFVLCVVCCVFDSVCELCGETIRNMSYIVIPTPKPGKDSSSTSGRLAGPDTGKI